MANKQINQLPAATEVAGTYRFPIQDADNITKNITADQLASYTKVAIGYNNVVFVNPDTSNDQGEINNIFKPFRTVAEAQQTLMGSDPLAPGLVILTKCVYNESVKLQDNTVYYCEPGVVFTFGGFSDTSNNITCKVLGYAVFVDNSIALTLVHNTKIVFEFDYIDNKSYALFIGGENCDVTVYGNSIVSQAANGFCISIRNKSFSKIFIKTQIVSYTYHTIFYRDVNGKVYSGKSYIKCPVIEGRALAESVKVIWSDITSEDTSSIEIDGDLICTNTTNNDYYGGVAVISYGKFTLNGNIICDSNTLLKGLSTTHYGVLSEEKICLVEINGNIITQNECIAITWGVGTGNYKITVNGNLYSEKGAAVISNNNNRLVLNNAQIVSGTDGNLITDTPDTEGSAQNKHLYIFNCLFFSPGVSGFCVATDSFDITASFHNVRSNKKILDTVSDILIPSGFIHDENFVIPA